MFAFQKQGMNTIQHEKKLIRKAISKIKSEIPFEEKRSRSISILRKIEQDPFFKQSKILLAYWSLPDEVHTHDFVVKWSQSKRIMLPVVDGDTLLLKEFRGIHNLIPGQRHHIPEPSGDMFNEPETIELAIIPGVAFDRQLNRLGRGKAYYDKLLPKLHVRKYGVCFNFQFMDKVPANSNDVRMNEVFTEG
jgi:5-formyltetrahydrofolate cyclo-ligase